MLVPSGGRRGRQSWTQQPDRQRTRSSPPDRPRRGSRSDGVTAAQRHEVQDPPAVGRPERAARREGWGAVHEQPEVRAVRVSPRTSLRVPEGELRAVRRPSDARSRRRSRCCDDRSPPRAVTATTSSERGVERDRSPHGDHAGNAGPSRCGKQPETARQPPQRSHRRRRPGRPRRRARAGNRPARGSWLRTPSPERTASRRSRRGSRRRTPPAFVPVLREYRMRPSTGRSGRDGGRGRGIAVGVRRAASRRTPPAPPRRPSTASEESTHSRSIVATLDSLERMAGEEGGREVRVHVLVLGGPVLGGADEPQREAIVLGGRGRTGSVSPSHRCRARADRPRWRR